MTEWRPAKPCAICRKWHGTVLAIQGGVAVIRCDDCGLYYVDAMPRLTTGSHEQQEAVKKENDLASKQGPTYLEQVYQREKPRWLDYYSNALSQISNVCPGRRLLDVGCGAGLLVRAACDMGWDAHGLDTSAETVEYGRQAFGLGDRLQTWRLEEARFPRPFDVVTLFSVIEHVQDPQAFILQAKRIIRPKGLIMVRTPSQGSLITHLHWMLYRASAGKIDTGLYNRVHIYRFSPKTLNCLLQTAGFQPLRWYFDDELWITATRYLLFRRQRALRLAILAALNRAGKLLRMENQMVMIARNNE